MFILSSKLLFLMDYIFVNDNAEVMQYRFMYFWHQSIVIDLYIFILLVHLIRKVWKLKLIAASNKFIKNGIKIKAIISS